MAAVNADFGAGNYGLQAAIIKGDVSASFHLPPGKYITGPRLWALITCHPDHEDVLRLLPFATDAPFNSYNRQHESSCLPDTRVDILQKISQWADSQHRQCIFWLSGMAGTGKSAIAYTIARKYEKSRLGASFFFSRGGGEIGHARKFFTSIALQLARQSLVLRRLICEAITECRDIADRGLREQWIHLILQPLSKVGANSIQSPLLIVVDALDECDGDSDVKTILRSLIELHKQDTPRLYIFITSRPETAIRLGFDEMPGTIYHSLALHDISPAIVDQDILVFFREKFKEMRGKFEGLAADWPGDQKINTLVNRANGLFIYAATAWRFIEGDGHWPPQDRLNAFLSNDGARLYYQQKYNISFPPPTSELDMLYTQILQRLFEKIQQNRDGVAETFRQVVGSLVVLSEPLSASSLAELLDIPLNLVNLRLGHLHSVLNIPRDQKAPIRLLHPSFRDFLLDKERCLDQTLWVKETQRHELLTQHCINLMSTRLKRDICEQQAPGSSVKGLTNDQIEQYIPSEVRYACLYWVQHLQKSNTQLFDTSNAYHFLQEHFLHWLEALGWIGKIAEGIHALSSLEAQISVSILYNTRNSS